MERIGLVEGEVIGLCAAKSAPLPKKSKVSGMKRWTAPLLAALALCAVQAWAAVSPPNLHETFSTSSPANWLIGGTGGGGTVDTGNSRMVLTNTGGHESGYAIYNQAFDSSLGVSVTFDYYSGGGSGADGISFFLLDGAVVTPYSGDNGAALGYTYYLGGSADHPNPTNGVPSAYVGIGFDEYGNFSTQTATGSADTNAPGFSPQHVVLRGSGSGMSGYGYLAGYDVSGLGGVDGGWRRVNIYIEAGHHVDFRTFPTLFWGLTA